MRFKVGDRVRNIVPVGCLCRKSVMGTVVYIRGGVRAYGVLFDENVSGHRGGGDYRDLLHGYAWNCREEDLEYLDMVPKRKYILEFKWT